MADRQPAEVFPPCEFIREEIQARGWSQAELAEIMGRSDRDVSDLLLGKRAISPEIAMELEAAFGIPALHWLSLEDSYRVWRLRSGQDTEGAIRRRAKLYETAPVKEMLKRQWIEPSESIDVMEHRIMRYFDIPRLGAPITIPHAARRGNDAITQAQWAWLFRAKHLAPAVAAPPFSARSFEGAISELKLLLRSRQEVRRVPRVLAEAGIRFLVVEQLPKTRIDGALLWLDERSPVIALSARYDRIDWFWFTLAHELGHIQRRDQQATIIDADLVGEDAQAAAGAAEVRADRFAAGFLVNQAALENFILRFGPQYSKRDILGFAADQQVHPGIVVGQLQHRQEVPWGAFRALLEKVRDIITATALTDGWDHVPLNVE